MIAILSNKYKLSILDFFASLTNQILMKHEEPGNDSVSTFSTVSEVNPSRGAMP